MIYAKNIRCTALAASALSVIATLSSTAAFAEDRAATAEQASLAPDNDQGLTDIVVTTQKRSESSQRVAASVTALSSDALETRQIQSVTDLQSEVPSLVVNRYFGTSVIALHGISTGVTSGAEDPSIATHINGVYQPRSRSVDSAMADLERVEVLSGPQGTLYGRNATGGVINYILKAPTESFEGEITGRVGNYDRYGGQAAYPAHFPTLSVFSFPVSTIIRKRASRRISQRSDPSRSRPAALPEAGQRWPSALPMAFVSISKRSTSTRADHPCPPLSNLRQIRASAHRLSSRIAYIPTSRAARRRIIFRPMPPLPMI